MRRRFGHRKGNLGEILTISGSLHEGCSSRGGAGLNSAGTAGSLANVLTRTP
jgi:hypothetical protein